METKDIELRSERVRHLIGKIPPLLIRLGISFIAVLIVALLMAAWFIPYPENLRAEVEIISDQEAIGYVAYSHINQLEKDMPVRMELEGYNSRSYGYLKGHIQNISKEVIQREGKNYFTVTIQFVPNAQIEMKEQMKGNIYILLSDESILKHIMGGISSS